MPNQIDNDSKIIAGDDRGFGHPAIVRCSDTLMFAGHVNDSDELEIHKSIDNGSSWTLVKTITDIAGARKFSLIAINSTSAGFIYSYFNTNYGYQIYITTNSGTDWTLKKTENYTGTLFDAKYLLIYNSNISRLYAVAMRGTQFVGRYTDNLGDSWTDWSGTGGVYSNLVDVDIDYLTNYIYVYYHYSGSPPTYVHYWKSFTSNGTYIAQSTVLGVTGNTYPDQNLAIDSLGNRYITYVKNVTATLRDYLMVRKNEGSETQLFYVDLASPQIIKGSVAINVDANDNIYVFYTKIADGKTYYKMYNGSTWGTETELIGVANNRINCEKHVLEGSDKLHFAYYRQP